MTSQTETTNFDMNFMDLLRKKFSEEKKAHEETTLQLLTAQAQARTAEAQAAKAQKLVAETTMKLDQACEEIKRLRVLTRGGQVQALEAQAKIESLEGQMAQMKLSEQSQAQTAIEAQEEVKSLRAQAQESQEAHAKTQQSLAHELETAQAKIASLEAAVAKARAAFAESEVATSPDHTAQDQAQELKAAQVKIENLEVQMAQMKLFEQFQAQAQELKAALARITELESQMAQNEKQAQEEIVLLKSEIQDQKAQAQELLGAQAQAQEAQTKITDLEAQIAQMRLSEQSQAQTAIEAQEEIRKLTVHVQYERAKAQKIGMAYAHGRETQAQKFQDALAMIKDLEAQIAQMRLSEQSQAQTAIEAQEEVRSLRAQAQKLVKAEAKIKDLEAQVTKPLVQVHVPLSSEWYALSWKSHEQLFRIKQSSGISYFAAPVSANTHLLFCKFVPDETAFLELAIPDVTLISWFRVIVSDGKRWTILGQLGPFNSTILIEKRMLRQAPSRINADGKKEYKLVICCERLPNVSSY